MLNALDNMGENVLVIMPHKYALPSFRTSAGGRQHLDQNEISIVEKYVTFLQENVLLSRYYLSLFLTAPFSPFIVKAIKSREAISSPERLP